MLKLSQLNSGQVFKLVEVPSGLKAELIRLGLCVGDQLQCISKIPFGAVVIQKDLVEIAVGFNYAREILVDVN
ncbi:MAG: ferrous iron transport protein A [Candidatus Caenarcaniphilales bacterium]|jgi:Fe2+ transport system protein FeoA|nr:ferrous iron transport protein A [Candidatus Caenarcaniphilales bacterium]